MDEQTEKSGKTIIETIEVAGNQLVDRVKELAQEAKVRQVKIVADDGDVFFETPLNIGLVVGGVVVLAAPWLAILGTIAALATKVRIEIEREADDDDKDGPEARAETKQDAA